MKLSSISEKRMPPAVEMARSIGKVPVSRSGNDWIKQASVRGSILASLPGQASWRSPMATGDSAAALRRNGGELLNVFGKTRPLLPIKVFSPRSSHQARVAAGGKRSIAAHRRE